MTNKNCTQCGSKKLLSDFNRHSSRKSGYDDQCRSCVKIYKDSYNRSREGHLAKIYSSQKKSSKRRGHCAPSYSLKELKKWALGQFLYEKIFKEWIVSGYSRWEAPSVDRIDDYKPYTLNNIQLMKWNENFNKGMEDRKNGILNKLSLSVVQMTRDKEFIADHYSISSAQRITSIDKCHISKCCKGKRRTAGGFCWKYKDENT